MSYLTLKTISQLWVPVKSKTKKPNKQTNTQLTHFQHITKQSKHFCLKWEALGYSEKWLKQDQKPAWQIPNSMDPGSASWANNVIIWGPGAWVAWSVQPSQPHSVTSQSPNEDLDFAAHCLALVALWHYHIKLYDLPQFCIFLCIQNQYDWHC